MNQSFENTFRLPYLFKFYIPRGYPEEIFLRLIDGSGCEVSSRDPHGFVSLRMKDPPWWYIAESKREYASTLKESLLHMFRRAGVDCEVIDSP